MCWMLYHANKISLFSGSILSLLLTFLSVIFYDCIIKIYISCFGQQIGEIFRYNSNVTLKDLFGGFLSYFLGPLISLILTKDYNIPRLSNRLSIVTAISEDIPQGIIAMYILITQDGWNSELAFLQILSSIIAGIVKYFVGLYFETNRQSLSANDGNVSPLDPSRQL
jgi:hypothetical protein